MFYNFKVTPEAAADVSRHALETTLLIAAPFLILSLVVGLLISIFQAVTQIQEVTLTFVPKIIAVFAAAFLFGAWASTNLMEFVKTLLRDIPKILGTL